MTSLKGNYNGVEYQVDIPADLAKDRMRIWLFTGTSEYEGKFGQEEVKALNSPYCDDLETLVFLAKGFFDPANKEKETRRMVSRKRITRVSI